ncbi:hypothetical protein RRG08_027225 [Elysia crispata]|uniref:Uncharacterized protein n=1 Tax=Elysia crispata TaxID=231223 RepID=A0AAE1DLZ0_9GAST|nr:hypothetical protein RRG08_027225 [Elysia crispata]
MKRAKNQRCINHSGSRTPQYSSNCSKVKDNHHIFTVDQLEESLEGHFTTESIILHQELSMTEVGMTMQQFMKCLDRMLNHPDTSLITSQATLRPLQPMMLSGLWTLPSTMQLPSMRAYCAVTICFVSCKVFPVVGDKFFSSYDDDDYRALKDHFLMCERGRRPALPSKFNSSS